MAFAPYILQGLAPNSATDYANQAADAQAKQTGQNIANQAAQANLAANKRAMAVSILNGIQNEPDQAKQAALYSRLAPMAVQIDPTLQLPEQYDPELHKALYASQIAPKEQASINLEQQKIDQGNFEPVKDYLGNVTGFLNKKTGEVQKNTTDRRAKAVKLFGR
jgi:hypothetical protein